MTPGLLAPAQPLSDTFGRSAEGPETHLVAGQWPGLIGGRDNQRLRFE